jgi:mono/diheme cytochrome c family protein
MRSGVKGKLRYGMFIVVALISMLAVGCYNNNTGETSIGGAINFTLPAFPETGSHAVVVVSEMHYQPSYRVQEVPRLLPPDGSVPVTGREVLFTTPEEYEQLTIPDHIASDVNSAARGQATYQTNCVVCHGPNLDGQGRILDFPTSANVSPAPANLVSGAASTTTHGELFAWISYGGQAGFASALRGRDTPSWMPVFGRLLTEDERWELVTYLRSQQGQ